MVAGTIVEVDGFMERNGKPAEAFSEETTPQGQDLEQREETVVYDAPEQSAPNTQKASPADDELGRLTAERDSLLDRLARLQAEFENARKRVARESLEYRDRALADLAAQLLPVIDNFDLALKADSTPEKLRQGVELIRRQLDDILKNLGVQPVESHGKPFDPHQHEAIEMVESEEHPENHVVEELRRGYKHKEKLLRPAMVRVAKSRN
jgi:molecular chaperone GrpE